MNSHLFSERRILARAKFYSHVPLKLQERESKLATVDSHDRRKDYYRARGYLQEAEHERRKRKNSCVETFIKLPGTKCEKETKKLIMNARF